MSAGNRAHPLQAPRAARGLPFRRYLALVGTLVLVQVQVWAQSAPKAPMATAPASSSNRPAGNAATAAKVGSKPGWHELTPAQQQALKPLAANWGSLSENHKRKWIALSRNYPSMSAPEQVKMHSRMAGWASLSPEQRTEARLNFSEAKKLSPDEKSATWQAYQALSPQERQRLADEAPPKPAGATAVVKPVPPQKLAVVPVTRQASKPVHKLAVGGHADAITAAPANTAGAEPPAHKN